MYALTHTHLISISFVLSACVCFVLFSFKNVLSHKMAKPSSAIPSREKLEKTLIPQLKQYVLTDKLGSGSYSTVYKAFNKVG